MERAGADGPDRGEEPRLRTEARTEEGHQAAPVRDRLAPIARPGVVDVRTVVGLQRLAGNVAVTALVRGRPVQRRAVQREDSGAGGAEGGTSGAAGAQGDAAQGNGDTKARLLAVAADLEKVLEFASPALAAGEPDPSGHAGVLRATISKVREAAASGDAKQQGSVLAAFSGPNLKAAEASLASDGDGTTAGGSEPVGALPDGPDAEGGASSSAVSDGSVSNGAAPDIAATIQPLLAAVANSARLPAASEASPGTAPMVQRDLAVALADAGATTLRMDAVWGSAGAEFGPVEWALVGGVALAGVALLGASYLARQRSSGEAPQPVATEPMEMQGPRAAGQLTNVARHLARLLGRGSVGGVPSGEPPKNKNDNDNHWWKEIKGSLRQFWQAIKGASRKQVLAALAKAGVSQAEVSEVEAALKEAGELMGEDPGPLLPPQ